MIHMQGGKEVIKMQEKVSEDRRIFERIPVDFTARLRDPSDQGTLEVSCQDISAGGIGVVSSQLLVQNAHLEMWLETLDKKGSSLYLYGKVVWANQIKGDTWRAGICFDEPQFLTLSRLFK